MRSVLVQKTKMSTRKLVSVSVTRNGVTTKIPCTQEVADMLMSKEIAGSSRMILPEAEILPHQCDHVIKVNRLVARMSETSAPTGIIIGS